MNPRLPLLATLFATVFLLSGCDIEALLADPKVAPLVLVRVSPTTALVLQENVEALQEALLQAGHLPRLVAPGAGEELKAQSPGEPAPAAEPPSPEESGRGERADEPGGSGRRGRSKRSARPSDWGDEEELAKILRRLLKQ